MKKKILLSLWLSLLVVAVSFLLWKNEYKYSLPTPIPKNYHDVAMGTKIDLSQCCVEDNKPAFIHFFNPDCPCSRFNVPHVSSLIKKYGDKINFKIVVLNKDKNFTDHLIATGKDDKNKVSKGLFNGLFDKKTPPTK
jgi:hypothetical protein